MLDIVIFAVIAVFLGLRLFSLLGRHDGDAGRSAENNWIERAKRHYEKNNTKPKTTKQVKKTSKLSQKKIFSDKPQNDIIDTPEKLEIFDAKTPLGKGLKAIQKADPEFRLEEFLEGAEAAFELIINTFAKGNKKNLQSLLNPETYNLFASAITAREKQKNTLHTTLLGINLFEAQKAGIKKNIFWIQVKIISDQINFMSDAEGNIVEGDKKKPETITDFWTFTHNILSNQPNWYLNKTDQ